MDYEWLDVDLRPDGCEDALFYGAGYGHDTIVRVSKGDRTIEVAVDGEVNVAVYTRDGKEFTEVGRIRSCTDLAEFGVTKDGDIMNLPSVSVIGASWPDVYGPNDSGFYFDLVHTNWYDLYSGDGEHVDAVCHTLSDAIRVATGIINDDSDELWTASVTA